MDLNQLYDSQTIEVIRRVLGPSSSAVDVGCHRGDILRHIIGAAPDGTHFAFEPLPDLFTYLQATFGGTSRICLSDVALSDHTGQVSFQHVVTNPGYSGLRRRRYDRDHEEVMTIQVRTGRLDDLLPAEQEISLVKIDVEGAELQVVQGAKQTLSRWRPTIVFEHGLGSADHYGTTPEMMFDFLGGEAGLRCFTMGDWLASNGEKALTREEFCSDYYSGRNFYFLAAV